MIKQPIARLFCKHHNKIQFIGYEVANLVLFFHHAHAAKSNNSLEHMGAALAFLCGSGAIFFFHPNTRPYLLYFGGVFLTVGGFFLVLAGYPITGGAVVLASLETARGGLNALISHVRELEERNEKIPLSVSFAMRMGLLTLSPYNAVVAFICGQFAGLGTFINERPFLTSALIKFPMRLDMIVRQLLVGDLIGACVGLSWMILGDGALAFNDQRLNNAVSKWASKPNKDLEKPATITTTVGLPRPGSR